ncbi:hypothetical protein [Micromonospora sp. NPDC005324]|uniref:hypothetical protein n=1 Tax=Micromonospora sp. NPDC005324 TaxID=3157033 RepID=UPI0033BD7E79
MIRQRQARTANDPHLLVRRRAAGRGVTRRRTSSTTAFEAPLTAISASLAQLRVDIDALVDTAQRRPTASRRAALVDVHHQLRLLGQRVNAALGAPPMSADDSSPHA